MPIKNEIKPFGLDPSAQVFTPAEWAALSKRITGYGNGIVDQKSFNTPHRQSSFVAAMIAQFTADYAVQDVLDDGDLAAFEANFLLALTKAMQAALQSGLLHYCVDGSAAANVVDLTGTAPVPDFSTLSTPLALLVKITTTNTGATTIVLPHALGTYSILRPDGSTLTGGELINNGISLVVFNGSNFVLVSSIAGGGVSTTGSGFTAQSGEGVSVNIPNANFTVTIASPGVVTWNGHGLANGVAVLPQTTGALPTGLTAGVTYYVINATTNTFQLAATPGGAAINTSGAQSGVHTMYAVGVATVNLNIPGLTNEPNIDPGDSFGFWDTSASHHRNITVAQFLTRQKFGFRSCVSYSAAGSYSVTVPSWARTMRYRVWGGGGCGGNGGNGGAGGGGGGGEYREGSLQVAAGGTVQPGDTLALTVGAGGANNGLFGSTMNPGGSSSIGALVTCLGGVGGGSTATPYDYRPGGAGGAGGAGGDVAFPGSGGGSGNGYWNGSGGGAFGTPIQAGQFIFTAGANAGTAGAKPGGGGSGSGGTYGTYLLAGAGADGRIDIWFEA